MLSGFSGEVPTRHEMHRKQAMLQQKQEKGGDADDD